MNLILTDKGDTVKIDRQRPLILLLLTETWKQALDLGKVVGVLFVDFHEAFDQSITQYYNKSYRL